MAIALSMHLRALAQTVGRHEAGHYVIARANNFVTGECGIEIIAPPDSHSAFSTIELSRPLPSINDIDQYLRARVEVLYAGALAQSLDNDGSIDNEAALQCIRNGGGVTDYARARELIQLLRNIVHPISCEKDAVQAQLDILDSQLWQQTAESVIREAAPILALGRAIASKVTKLGTPFRLVKEEIEAIAAIKARFSIDKTDKSVEAAGYSQRLTLDVDQ